MQGALTASILLKSLVIIQSISVLTLVLGIAQFFFSRFRFTVQKVIAWLLIPLVLFMGCYFYEKSHRQTLLKQRLSQSWRWEDENGEYNLVLNTEACTYVYGFTPLDKQNETRNGKGSTSHFKAEMDVVSQETYSSLYLFDFPQRGYTSMIAVDGASSPKIYITNSKVYELQ